MVSMTVTSIKLSALSVAAVLASLALPAAAAPLAGATRPAVDGEPLVTKAQVGIYFGYGRPYRRYGYDYGYGYGYRPYYGYRRAYRDDGYYVQSRPYVVAPAPAYRSGGYDPDEVARCASRFRSFNAYTGTYTTYDGE